MQKTFQTNLRCGACVEAIRPAFDGDPAIRKWSVDVTAPGKPLTVEGDAVDAEHVAGLLAKAGYKIVGESSSAPAMSQEPAPSYFPLLVILTYLVVMVAVFEWAQGSWNSMRAMRHFMAGFFLVFSFFKLLDVSSFANTFAMYDVLAKRSHGYALAYPFIELGLGLAYLGDWQPIAVNVVTLVVMGVGAVGVIQSLSAKRKIQCACLGTVFNLPMSSVTLIEDVLMAGMAAVMLIAAIY